MNDFTPSLWFAGIVTSLASVAVAQKPAWIQHDAFPSIYNEAGWFDAEAGRPLALRTSTATAVAGPLLELDASGWITRLSATAAISIAPTNFHGTNRSAFDVVRGVSVHVIAGSPPVTCEWDGIDWRIITTPTSLPPTLCIGSVSWNGRPGAAEVLATVGGQVWGYDGTDWRYRGGLPFDPNYGVWVPAANVHLFGSRYGPPLGSLVAWDGAATMPVTFSGAALPNSGFGAGNRMVFDTHANRLVTVTRGGPALSYAGTLTASPGAAQIAWTQLANAPGPGNTLGHAPNLIYDSVRRKAVYFGGFSPWDRFVAELASGANTWTIRQTLISAPQPSGRTNAELAYDRQRQRTVMFGGSDNATEFQADTWTFDGSVWQAHGVDPNVLGRSLATLAYIGSIDRVLMFGGNTESAGAVNELWAWNGTQWQGVGTNTPRPAARYGHDMVWHEARDRVVLFGGTDGVQLLTDTWEYDPVAQTWQQIATPSAPAPRNFGKLVYDSQRQRVVLFGGAGASVYDDTWAYSTPTGGWSLLPTPVRPAGRWGHAMEYDSQRHRIVMHGGWGYVPCGSTTCLSTLGDHWEFDSTMWVHRPSAPATSPGAIPSTFPSGRTGSGMTFDLLRKRMVLFGGTNGTDKLGDLWDFDSANDSFGIGQASGGVALRSRSPAVAGNDLTLEFESPSAFGWLAIHLQTEPIPTHFIDPPLICSSRAWFYGTNPIVASASGNPGRLQFLLPTWLLGYGLEFQAIAFDAPGFCLRVSDPLAVTVQAP